MIDMLGEPYYTEDNEMDEDDLMEDRPYSDDSLAGIDDEYDNAPGDYLEREGLLNQTYNEGDWE